MSIILYNNGGSENHGCEAIIRGTKKILKENITIMSLNKSQELKYHLDKIVNIENAQTEYKRNIRFFLYYSLSKFFHKYIYLDILPYENSVKNFEKGDIAISIGGDTYCYGYNELNIFLHRLYTDRHIKTFLWGCSIDEDAIVDSKVIKDLKSYDLIFPRESLTYNNLKNVGLNNIYLMSDPAFQLDKVDLPLPSNFIEGNTVGINVSPLIMSNENKNGITKENYIELCRYILDNTDMNIALIPHVVWENNDDRVPLTELYNLFKDTNRVCLIEDHNCMELKGYISRCRLFVGARTHATIAAYSTCVPTLVVGYSIKAKGIAKDIFGTYDNYVLPVQSLENKDDLTNDFKWLLENENDIRNHLEEFMPDYKAKALEAGKKIKELF